MNFFGITKGDVEPKVITLEQLDKMGFHFTPHENESSILETGLRPSIGANSSGDFGKEATEKTFISYGRVGMLQMVNRLLNIGTEMPLHTLRTMTGSEKFLSERLMTTPENRTLSLLESFEYVKRYLSDKEYFVADLREPRYSNEPLTDEQTTSLITGINAGLDKKEGISYSMQLSEDTIQTMQAEIQKISLAYEQKQATAKSPEELEKLKLKKQKIEDLLSNATNLIQGEKSGIKEVGHPKSTISAIDKIAGALRDRKKSLSETEKQTLSDLGKLRSEITLSIREQTKKSIDMMRGNIVDRNNANFERIDYNEDAIMWVDQARHPHNTHTMIYDGSTKGEKLEAADLELLSTDGVHPATGLDVAQAIYTSMEEIYRTSDDRTSSELKMDIPGRHTDPLLIDGFMEYVRICDKNKNNPEALKSDLIELRERLLSSPELAPKFAKEIKPSTPTPRNNETNDSGDER